jgi:uncharacterized protein YjdB
MGNTNFDISKNGDLVYWTNNFSVGHYRNGIHTPQSSSADGSKNYYPKTDGNSVIYIKEKPNKDILLILKRFNENSYNEIAKFNFAAYSQYDIRNGWISYVEPTSPSAINSYNLIIMSPDGEKHTIVRNAFRIQILSTGENGEVVFTEGIKGTFLAKHGSDKLIKLTHSTVTDKIAKSTNGQWYFMESGVLYSVNSSLYVPVTGISFETPEIRIPAYIGSKYQLKAQFEPSKVSNWDVNFTSSVPGVVIIDGRGTAYIDMVGETIITAKSADGGYIATVTLDVYIPVSSVNLPEDLLIMSHPSEKILSPEILPTNAGNKTLFWSTSNPEVVKVDSNGKLQTVAVGEAFITVTTESGGRQDTMTVKVVDSPSAVPSITGLGFIVSGTDYPAIIDENDKTITVTLPKVMFNSKNHILTHMRLNATSVTSKLDLTIGGQEKKLEFSDGSKLYSAQVIFGKTADPEGDGISVCTCQEIIKQFPQFIAVLYDSQGNRSVNTYTIRLKFQ